MGWELWGADLASDSSLKFPVWPWAQRIAHPCSRDIFKSLKQVKIPTLLPFTSPIPNLLLFLSSLFQGLEKHQICSFLPSEPGLIWGQGKKQKQGRRVVPPSLPHPQGAGMKKGSPGPVSLAPSPSPVEYYPHAAWLGTTETALALYQPLGQQGKQQQHARELGRERRGGVFSLAFKGLK